MPPSDVTLLRDLLKGSEVELDAFLKLYDTLDAAKTALSAEIKAAAEYLREISTKIGEEANAPQLLADATARHGRVKAGRAGFK
jgi:hypothetical protein